MNSVSHNQTFTWSICQKLIASCDHAVQCGNCHLLIHCKCNGLTIKDCKHLKLNNEVFFLKNVYYWYVSLKFYKFNTVMNSRKPSDIELLASLDFISKITSLGGLIISDIESNIPNPLNSKYYYPSDFWQISFTCITFAVLFLLISR